MLNVKSFESYFKNLKNKDVYIGFSGGADSLMVLHLANIWKKIYHYNVTAINFEHGIRGQESIDDTNFCINICKSLNIPIIVKYLHIGKDCKNVECVARAKRIDMYNSLIGEKENSVLLLGHHLNDKIENFFIRLARGSNISGLCGLKDNVKIGNVLIGRPLLNTSKEDIVEYLKSVGILWRTDSTNFEDEYVRNYIRNKMLPNWFKQCNFIRGGVQTAIENIQKDADFIELYAEEKFKELNKKYPSNVVEIKFFKDLHESIRFRVLKMYINSTIENFELSKGLFNEFSKMIFAFDNTNVKELTINKNFKFIIRSYKVSLISLN